MKRILISFFMCIFLQTLYAQVYLISFTGTGSSTTVDSVKVENLTQKKSISINGNENLLLTSYPTGLSPIKQDQTVDLQFYPNPMMEFSHVDFDIQETGLIKIYIYDISGRTIAQIENYLQKGSHSYEISGLKCGVYFVKIKSPKIIYSGKLLNTNLKAGNPQITHIQSLPQRKTPVALKRARSEVYMQYTTGDRLRFTGTSGKFSTVLTDIPTQSKAITFNFWPCSDADGNNYSVVQIRRQVWMAENLKTAKYNDGTNIPNINNEVSWRALTTGAYYLLGNNQANIYKSIYGALYNWYTIKTEKLCPFGWHVPSDDEWITLVTHLGGYSEAAYRLKEASTTYWGISNSADNASGFSALPGGALLKDNTYGAGDYGYWWSSTKSSSDYYTTAYSWHMYCANPNIFSTIEEKTCGFNVRCVKDEPAVIETVPVLSTSDIVYKSSTAAISGGNITHDGWATVTMRGVCWSTNENPTITDNRSYNDSGDGNFISNITGLTANTTYYIRAYATNKIGTGYGPQIKFTTLSSEGNDSLTDIDGNIYAIIKIGTQVWMKENLKTTKYKDGTIIPYARKDTSLSGTYNWYDNNVTYKNKYGALYDWYTVKTALLCPLGWHVPSRSEWSTLINLYGGEEIAGGKMKSKSGWSSPNTGATNESDFSALPGGFNNGDFTALGKEGRWWSTDQGNISEAWFYYLSYYNTYAYRAAAYKGSWNSVRCIKD